MSVFRSCILFILQTALIFSAGCASAPFNLTQQVASPGPLMVHSTNEELVWERTADVLHNFLFEIERENKLTHEIVTEYKVGASMMEPWHLDSVGTANRLESTLQSIRRKVIVRVVPTDDRTGHWVTVEAFKEIEVPNGVVANSPGGATFEENNPLQRDLNLTVGQTLPTRWQSLGRDGLLERAILEELRTNLSH